MINSDKPVSSQNLENYFDEDFKRQKNLRKKGEKNSLNSPPETQTPIAEADDKKNNSSAGAKKHSINDAEKLQLRHSNIAWHGRLAARLGLPKEVKKEHFKRICEGRHPISGEQLIKAVKPRKKLNRKGKEFETLSRRAGMPQSISAPKSVSLLVPHDERVIAAHHQAVIKALDTIELFTSVKMGNSKSPELTGEAIRALFTHFDARPDAETGFSSLDLHTHCPPLNLGFDCQGKARALEFRDILRSQKLGTAVYRAELVKGMKMLGYEMEINEKTGAPEVLGISRQYIEASSTRHREIVKRAKSLGLKSTKEVAVSYRQSKKFDRTAMNARRAALDEQFDFEAQRTAAKALRKTDIKKIGSFQKQTTSDKQTAQSESQKIIVDKIQKTVEAVDYVLSRADRQKIDAPKTFWISTQNLLAETINHAHFELTIDDVFPEFQKRLAQGELNRFNLDKRTGNFQKKHSIPILENDTEAGVKTGKIKSVKKEQERHVESNRTKSKSDREVLESTRKESDDIFDESKVVFVSGRNNSGGVDTKSLRHDPGSISVGNGRHQTAPSRRSGENGNKESTPKNHNISQNISSNSRNNSNDPKSLVSVDNRSSDKPKFGNAELTAQSSDTFNTDSFGDVHGSEYLKNSDGAETQAGKIKADIKMENVQPFNADDSADFDNDSFAYLHIGQSNTRAANLDANVVNAVLYADNYSVGTGIEINNDSLRIDLDTRREILDFYRINEARKAEYQTSEQTNSFEPTQTNDRIYKLNQDCEQILPVAQPLTDYTEFSVDQNFIQPANHSDFNQQFAEQNAQNQIKQTADYFRCELERAGQDKFHCNDEVRRNFVTYSHISQISEEEDFWKKDRLEREAQIARESAEMKSKMSESERRAYEAAEIAEADDFERNEELLEEWRMKI